MASSKSLFKKIKPNGFFWKGNVSIVKTSLTEMRKVLGQEDKPPSEDEPFYIWNREERDEKIKFFVMNESKVKSPDKYINWYIYTTGSYEARIVRILLEVELEKE